MSVDAELAQGTTLHIAGSPATPEVITAITVGYPTILAITGHAGVANGDVITLAGFTGADAATLNGKTAIVTHYATGASNDTFAIDINTVGKTVTVDTGVTAVTPTAWIKVGQLKGIDPTSSNAPDIDVTDLDSTRKEFRTGLGDPGTMSMEIMVKDSDVGYAAMLAAFNASTAATFKVTYPESLRTKTFTASVKQFPEIGKANVDGVITGTVELRRSGEVVTA